MKHLLSAAFLLCALPAWAQQPITTTVMPLPQLLPEEETQGEIYCRPPQAKTDSRLPGPKVCKPVAFWKKLHDQGLDISADGKAVVQSEKYRNINVCGQASC
jgi:hypothetical protein